MLRARDYWEFVVDILPCCCAHQFGVQYLYICVFILVEIIFNFLTCIPSIFVFVTFSCNRWPPRQRAARWEVSWLLRWALATKYTQQFRIREIHLTKSKKYSLHQKHHPFTHNKICLIIKICLILRHLISQFSSWIVLFSIHFHAGTHRFLTSRFAFNGFAVWIKLLDLWMPFEFIGVNFLLNRSGMQLEHIKRIAEFGGTGILENINLPSFFILSTHFLKGGNSSFQNYNLPI